MSKTLTAAHTSDPVNGRDQIRRAHTEEAIGRVLCLLTVGCGAFGIALLLAIARGLQ